MAADEVNWRPIERVGSRFPDLGADEARPPPISQTLRRFHPNSADFGNWQLDFADPLPTSGNRGARGESALEIG
ncbi:MAG TPA: hypothetical protein VEG34_13395 [Thermoanaerobaculia bacterium]|nr:hypothetical protein [Thermoanaerobaculia bacterium]